MAAGFAATFGLAQSASAADDVASSRMSYSRFLEYLDMGRVKKVDLYEQGTIAIVEAVSPELGNRVQRVRVQLPGTSSELLKKFREKNVDFAAHTNTEDNGQVFLNLLGNLAFPLLLVGGLFLLTRRQQGGGGAACRAAWAARTTPWRSASPRPSSKWNRTLASLSMTLPV